MNSARLLVVVLWLALVTLVAAQDLAGDSEKSTVEGRRRHGYKLLLKSLGPILSTLSTIMLVKFKIVLVALFFGGIYFFGHKIFPGGLFGSSIISETPPPFIDSGYGGYSGYSGHDIISSYPGPEPWTSDFHSSEVPQKYDGPSNAYLPPSRRKRQTENDDVYFNEIYWTDTLTDLGFRFLGVNSKACQKRFVCEFDYRARRNPILLFITRAIGRDIFHNYRDVGDEKAMSYQDCGRIYEECKVPQRKKYRRPHIAVISTTVNPSPTEETTDDYLDAQNEVDGNDSWRPLESPTTTVQPLGKLIVQSKFAKRLKRM